MNFNRLKISARLALGFGLTIAMGLAIAVFAILEMQQLSTDLRDVATQRMTKVQQLTVIAMNQSSMARLARNVLLRAPGSPENDADIKKIRQQRVENHEVMDQLLKTVVQTKNRELLQVIVDNRVQYNSDLDEAIAMAQQGQREVATRLLLGDARVVQQRMAQAAEEAIASQQESAQKLAHTAATTAGYDSMILMALVAVLAAAGVSVALLITRSLTRSLGAEPSDVSQAVERVAAGDLGVEIKTRHGDEASTMAAVRRMQDELRGIVRTVRGNADSVAIASSEIAQGNADLSSRTEQQASALQETAASMEQLGTTVKQNADNARQASQLALGASSVATRGGEVVDQVVEAMNDITGNSSKIADIIAVIDGIAFQTNLLALNAAVEAARAGEQGRGFSVVAAEVRNLAQRSASAAKDIKQLIDTSVLRVEQGAVLVGRAGDTMKEVVSAVQRVADIVGEISSASAEQSQGVMQVGEAVTQMDQATQQNAALVEESAAAADSLRTQAQQLVQAVAIFKFNDSREEVAKNLVVAEKETRALANKQRADSTRLPAPARLKLRPSLALAAAGGDDNWTSF